MIEVFRFEFSKRDLASLAPEVRGMILLSGHAMNWLTTEIKLVHASANLKASTDADNAMYAARTHILLRNLYGAIVEIWEWIKRPQNQRLIGCTYLSSMSTVSQEAYASLKRWSGKRSVLHSIRNTLAFHLPDQAELEEAFLHTPEEEDWSLYMAQSTVNSCWYYSELVMGHGSIRKVGAHDRKSAIQVLVSEAMEISDLLASFLQGLHVAMHQAHFTHMRRGIPVLRVEDVPKFAEYELPFFLETELTSRS